MQTSLETTLAELIAFPSVTKNADACLEVLEYARKQLAPLDLHITASDSSATSPWFFATTQKTLTPDILLVAHLDVVPGPDKLFTLQRSHDKLLGRGVYDMKLAAACYLEFFKLHASELSSLDIGVLFTTDEEIGGDSLREIFATGLRPKTAFIPDGGDNWQVEARAKGLYGLALSAKGKTAHGSRPWEGDNALHRILDMCHILRNEFVFTDPSGSTLAVTRVQGGVAFNQITDQASAHLDFRSFEASELARFKRRASELAKDHEIEVTFVQSGSPVIFEKNHEAVQSFLRTLSDLRGAPIEYCESYGGSDARYFAEYNVPCIIMEPYGGGRHAESEWLLASDLGEYYRLIETWLLTGASTPVSTNHGVAAA